MEQNFVSRVNVKSWVGFRLVNISCVEDAAFRLNPQFEGSSCQVTELAPKSFFHLPICISDPDTKIITSRGATVTLSGKIVENNNTYTQQCIMNNVTIFVDVLSKRNNWLQSEFWRNWKIVTFSHTLKRRKILLHHCIKNQIKIQKFKVVLTNSIKERDIVGQR